MDDPDAAHVCLAGRPPRAFFSVVCNASFLTRDRIAAQREDYELYVGPPAGQRRAALFQPPHHCQVPSRRWSSPGPPRLLAEPREGRYISCLIIAAHERERETPREGKKHTRDGRVDAAAKGGSRRQGPRRQCAFVSKYRRCPSQARPTIRTHRRSLTTQSASRRPCFPAGP